MKSIMNLTKKELREKLWRVQPRIRKILVTAPQIEEARQNLFDYLDRLGGDLYSMKPGGPFERLDVVEKRNARDCLRVLANTFRRENEYLAKASPLERLYDLAHDGDEALDRVTEGFLLEYLMLFEGCVGKSADQPFRYELLQEKKGRKAAIERSRQLDDFGNMMTRYYRRYRTGFHKVLTEERKRLQKDILSHFGGSRDDWGDYQWHLKHIIKDGATLAALVRLSNEEMEGLAFAAEHDISFQITPYYLSLFNREGRSLHDRAIRAQVMPSVRYGTNVVENWHTGKDMDFMGEHSTSPIDGITRRYPQIVIIKPYNSCPQICVYCQRNWEVKEMDRTDIMLPREKVSAALDWVRNNEKITEVLVTGGDPLTLPDDYLDWLLGEVAAIPQVERIRIGTRTPVTLPQRINEGLLKILAKYHEWGKREIALITHFEHPAEITHDTVEMAKKIKGLGINIYNQQVFTYYNSRKFESALLRKTLKLSGIDPYYSFNCMGKEETIDFRVPIARILQERKEEARLLPGLARTDEPVFNVPRLGKSHLRAWQDHEVIMILPDGRRIYRFYSWETELTTSKDFLYTDVGIRDYLKRMADEGEHINDYKSIFYYF